MTATHVVCVLMPAHIQSEANGRDHWRKAAARKKAHRALPRIVLGCLLDKFDFADGATVTLTRIAPRVLDDDNLASGFKALRDGIADCIGIDDGDKRMRWVYAQRKGKPKEYAAEVRIEAALRVLATMGDNDRIQPRR